MKRLLWHGTPHFAAPDLSAPAIRDHMKNPGMAPVTILTADGPAPADRLAPCR